MDILKATPELLTEYINFLLAFSRKPGEAIQSKTATTEGAEPSVSGKLVIFSLLSVGAAIVIVRIGAALGMAEDPSLVVKVAGGLDEKLLPFAALVALLVLSAVAHVVFKVAGLIGAVLGHQPFRGSIAGSVNAALGFAAWSIPLTTTMIVCLRIVAANKVALNSPMLVLVILLFGMAFWFYLAAAFAASHCMSIGRAGSLFALTIALITFLGKLF
jgi:hypothetical protein